MDTRFHCVYLLTSLDPHCEGDFYIGYTVNPLRRLRQHNGELVNGARRTSRRGRPWRIVCCVSGFTEDRAALKFEWCWQNPTVSTRLKHTVGMLKGLRRLPYAVGTLHLLVRAALFNQLDLTLHIFEPELLQEAQTKAEMFLATRAGLRPGRREPRTTNSQQSSTTGAVSTQMLSSSSVYGSASAAANSSPLLLPPLEPSALFHVEVITRQRFEVVYLSHDQCLLLPSAGVGGHVAAEREDEDSCLRASCPYDVSVLSQAARAEWSNASANDDGDGDAFDRGARRFGLMHSATPSHTPSRDRTPEHLLDGRSEKEEEEGDAEAVVRGLSPPPSTPSLSPPKAAGREGRTAASSPSRLRTPSSPTPTAAADTAPSPLRIPLRFAHYRDADFATDHADVQYRLHHGLLPCSLCALPLRPPCVVHCSRAPFCDLRCHLGCLAMWMLYEEEKEGRGHADDEDASHNKSSRIAQPLTQQQQQQQQIEGGASVRFCRLLPSQPCPCPLCGVSLQWGVLIKELKRRAVVEARLHAAQRRTRIEQRWQSRLAHLSGRRSAKEPPRQQPPQHRRRRLRTGGRASVGLVAAPPLLAPEALGASSASSVPTTGGDVSCISSAAVQSIASPAAAVELSAVSSITATVPRADLSGLTLTPFCEEEWLL